MKNPMCIAASAVVMAMSLLHCGAAPQSQEDASEVHTAALLPAPDPYFGMLCAREAAISATQAEGCGPIINRVKVALDGLKRQPQFTQLTDTEVWKVLDPTRDAYASAGCFASSQGSLLHPAPECADQFAKLADLWLWTQRTTQYHVLIDSKVIHDLRAAWWEAINLGCVIP